MKTNPITVTIQIPTWLSSVPAKSTLATGCHFSQSTSPTSKLHTCSRVKVRVRMRVRMRDRTFSHPGFLTTLILPLMSATASRPPSRDHLDLYRYFMIWICLGGTWRM